MVESANFRLSEETDMTITPYFHEEHENFQGFF